uniref:glutathione transferase n=1 Tax=Sinocyclocheilus rhinocerous TaxID=307959 RepID=A0A673N1G5_9TELE
MKVKAINLNKLCSKFDVDVSKNELSVKFCLEAVPNVSTRCNLLHINFQCAQYKCDFFVSFSLMFWNHIHFLCLAQPIRLLLEYTGTKYEEKFYSCGDEDGDKKVVQSNAIMRYIARKHNLCGETEEEQVRVDILENQAMDFRNGFVQLCYGDFVSD